MDFGQGVEATGHEPECVCSPCVNSLLHLHMFLFPVTCRFEVGGREQIPLESLACSKDCRLVVFFPTRPPWGEVSFMPGAIGPTGHVHWDMRERFPWPFPEIHPRDTDASVKMKASVRASVAAVAT